jgi:hypothetical protein
MVRRVVQPPKVQPALSADEPVFPDHIGCLDCGGSYTMRKRQIRTGHYLTMTNIGSNVGCRTTIQWFPLNSHRRGTVRAETIPGDLSTLCLPAWRTTEPSIARNEESSIAKERRVSETNELSFRVPYISTCSLTEGFFVSAAPGGGPPHAFQVDTGSVGIVVPRRNLGPDYQDFDPSLDIAFGYISSGKNYRGQWVRVPVVLGVPAGSDGMGAYAVADVEVFAVDHPTDFNGGIFGTGFEIGRLADGGPGRNPLLHLDYQGEHLNRGYIVTTQGIDVGLTSLNSEGFGFIGLDLNEAGEDWLQPLGHYSLSGAVDPAIPAGDLRILIDTGIDQMILWLSDVAAHPDVPSGTALPGGVSVSISVPADPILNYNFLTGIAGQPMASSDVEWRIGDGINTGRNVLAGADYLYDAEAGRVAFRILAT